MKKLGLLLFALILFACSGSDEEQYPTITVVNDTIEDNKKIRSISIGGIILGVKITEEENDK
jgi:hypothetical protein